jgi:hypothetical protein
LNHLHDGAETLIVFDSLRTLKSPFADEDLRDVAVLYWARNFSARKEVVMQKTATSLGMRRLTWITAAFLLASVSAVGAQVVIPPSTPQIGSSNPVTAEPPVPRPHTKPCVVQLFENLQFADFNLKSFNYTPPAACLIAPRRST